MLTPRMGNRVQPEQVWAADNGRWAPSFAYTHEKFMRFLDKHAEHRDRCLFAVAPDTWGDGVATLAESTAILPMIRERGYRAALVIQPGVDGIDWDALDCIFIGGPNEWQHGARVAELAAEARERGKWLHMGRVNTRVRIRYAQALGVDSADGTFIRFSPDVNELRLRRWLDDIDLQPVLGL